MILQPKRLIVFDDPEGNPVGPDDAARAAAEKERVRLEKEEASTQETADMYSSILEKETEAAKPISAEMTMLGAILGEESALGMVGGAVGAAIGGPTGAIVGSQGGKVVEQFLASAGARDTNISQFMPGNEGSGGAPSVSGSDTTLDPIILFKQMRGYLQTIARNTMKTGGKGAERM